MKWIIDPSVRERAPIGLAWLRQYLEGFDLSRVDWVRVDLGRGNHGGAYGRCWYPEGRRKGFRLSMQVPGPFPCQMVTRRKPIYLSECLPIGCLVRSRELLPGEYEAEHVIDSKDGVRKNWIRVRAGVSISSMDEAVVWVGAHEAFHFLRQSRQIPGRNDEIEADAHADMELSFYRSDVAAGRLPGRSMKCA